MSLGPDSATAFDRYWRSWKGSGSDDPILVSFGSDVELFQPSVSSEDELFFFLGNSWASNPPFSSPYRPGPS